MTAEPSPDLTRLSVALAKLQASEDDIDIAARTVWGEARGEGEAGMQAVAAVLINRAFAAKSFIAAKEGRKKHPLFGEGSLASASLAEWQFSCWNENDPNRDKLIKLGKADPGYEKAKAAVTWALANPDPTEGATHYYANSITAPDWSANATFTKKIGHHLFYKNVK